MVTPVFKSQMAGMKTQLAINSIMKPPVDYELVKDWSDEDLAWRAYDFAFEDDAQIEYALYFIYYNLIRRIPKLVIEIPTPSLFRSSLLVPHLFPTLDYLLRDFYYDDELDTQEEALGIYQQEHQKYKEVFQKLSNHD